MEKTCPSEERIEESHELKITRYDDLRKACETAGWSCYNMAIGIRGRAMKKSAWEAGQEALHCSKWIYWLGGNKEWKHRNVVPEQ